MIFDINILKVVHLPNNAIAAHSSARRYNDLTWITRSFYSKMSTHLRKRVELALPLIPTLALSWNMFSYEIQFVESLEGQFLSSQGTEVTFLLSCNPFHQGSRSHSYQNPSPKKVDSISSIFFAC